MNIYLKSLVIITASITLSQTAFSAASNSDFFSPYADLTINTHWDSQYQDMEPMDLSMVSQESGITSYHLAFITDAGSCAPAWGAQSAYSIDKSWGVHLTEKLRAKNISYIIAFGGASGNDLSMACSDIQLVKAYEDIIKIYKPQGLDFDIENGTANVAKIMHALQQIQKQHPELKISFTLPTLPEGLTREGENVVIQAKSAGLKFAVNIMAMDYGPSYVKDMGVYAEQAGKNLFRFLLSLYPEKLSRDIWKMVEITPMIGVNDVSVEEFTLQNVDTVRGFAQMNLIGGLSMWSVARDKPCADKWASPICSGNNLQSKPYEYAQRFMK
ncbi:MAG: chitinase [Gammaproteobacteria bacterium]